jgi:hypothetical protein
MSTVDWGIQTIIFDFKIPAKGKYTSRYGYNIFKPGIYKGGDLYVDTGEVYIAPFSAVFYTGTGTEYRQAVVIHTENPIKLTGTSGVWPGGLPESLPVVYGTYTWVEDANNFIDFGYRIDGVPEVDEVCFGEVGFLSGNYDDTYNDYSEKTFGLMNASDKSIQIDSILKLNEISELFTGQGMGFSSSVGIGTLTPNDDAHANANDLVISNLISNGGLQILSNGTSNGSVYFGVGGGTLDRGYISYSHSLNVLNLGVNSTTELVLSDGLVTFQNNGRILNQKLLEFSNVANNDWAFISVDATDTFTFRSVGDGFIWENTGGGNLATLSEAGLLTLQNNLSVLGNTTLGNDAFADSITINGLCSFPNAIALDRAITIGSSMKLYSYSGALRVGNPLRVDGQLYLPATSQTSADGLTISAVNIFNDPLSFTLRCDGNIILEGDLDVNRTTKGTYSLNVIGSAEITGTLYAGALNTGGGNITMGTGDLSCDTISCTSINTNNNNITMGSGNLNIGNTSVSGKIIHGTDSDTWIEFTSVNNTINFRCRNIDKFKIYDESASTHGIVFYDRFSFNSSFNFTSANSVLSPHYILQRYSGAGLHTVNGMAGVGLLGQIIIVYNGIAANLTLKHNTGTYPFYNKSGADINITQRQSAMYMYDAVTGWIQIA